MNLSYFTHFDVVMDIFLKIEGMSCGHCVSAVTDVLQEVEGVDDVNVSLGSGEATVKGSCSKEELLKAINETPGYKAY
ncbi:MAG: copper chaperone [Flavobacteriales bacterium]